MTDGSSLHHVYIAIGSNMGDREHQIMEAIASIHAWDQTEVVRISPIYETDPVGYTEQDPFLNIMIYVETKLEPLPLLRALLQLELQLGRDRSKQSKRFGPRVIDLDVLLYDDIMMDNEELILPHPRMMERAFVLVPLQHVIAPSHAKYAEITSLAAAMQQSGKEGVNLWKTTNWHKELEHSES